MIIKFLAVTAIVVGLVVGIVQLWKWAEENEEKKKNKKNGSN